MVEFKFLNIKACLRTDLLCIHLSPLVTYHIGCAFDRYCNKQTGSLNSWMNKKAKNLEATSTSRGLKNSLPTKHCLQVTLYSWILRILRDFQFQYSTLSQKRNTISHFQQRWNQQRNRIGIRSLLTFAKRDSETLCVGVYRTNIS